MLGDTYSHMDMRAFKTAVADAISTAIGDIGKKYVEVLSRDEGRYIDHVADVGAKKAQESANETMAIVKEAIGF